MTCLTKKLQSCPWCSHPAEISDDGGTEWFVGCINCHCDVKPHILHTDISRAIYKWNKLKKEEIT